MKLNIYIDNLRAYNECNKIGEWVNVFEIVKKHENEIYDLVNHQDQPLEKAVFNAVNEALKISAQIDLNDPNHDEWFVTDYESDFGISLSEYCDLFALFAFAYQVIDDNIDENVLTILIDNYSNYQDVDFDRADDVVCISDTSPIENTYDLGWACAHEFGIFDGNKNDNLERYFDYESYGRDLEIELGGQYIDGCYYYIQW